MYKKVTMSMYGPLLNTPESLEVNGVTLVKPVPQINAIYKTYSVNSTCTAVHAKDLHC